VLVQLKSLMEVRHSPFLKQLRHCLREILRDFKDDLKVMLAGDAQLASEIAFDLQEQEAEQGDPAAKIVDKPLQQHFNGASRRVSLGNMIQTPQPFPTPLVDISADLDASPCAGASGSVLPKARRSSVGSAQRMTPVKGGAVSTPAPAATPTSTPAPHHAPMSSPQHVPSLPVVQSQGTISELMEGADGGGNHSGSSKRRRGPHDLSVADRASVHVGGA